MILETNKIYCGDNLEIIKRLDDCTIDLTVTSPPYDNLREYNGYSWNFEALAQQLYRVTKEGGVVVWVVGDATINGSETGTSFRQALYFMECGFNLHDTMIYQKRGLPNESHKRYRQDFEYMFILSKSSPKTFNPILHKKKYDDKRKTKAMNRDKDGNFNKAKMNPHEMTKEGNVFFYVAAGGVGQTDSIAYQHPATFPEKLAEDQIISWSNKGDLILDPFMGSGTTAKMALKNERDFIGFEISQEYVDIANKRIEGWKEQTRLF